MPAPDNLLPFVQSPRHLALKMSLTMTSDTPSPKSSPRLPSSASRSLGDKLQILALVNPLALDVIEEVVDNLLKGL